MLLGVVLTLALATAVAAPPPDIAVAKIGTHVLVDGAGLDNEATTATPRVHRPRKDAANPILREEHPWEDRMHM